MIRFRLSALHMTKAGNKQHDTNISLKFHKKCCRVLDICVTDRVQLLLLNARSFKNAAVAPAEVERMSVVAVLIRNEQRVLTEVPLCTQVKDRVDGWLIQRVRRCMVRSRAILFPPSVLPWKNIIEWRRKLLKTGTYQDVHNCDGRVNTRLCNLPRGR